jgi:uncharacterized membrane protein YhaH (DUF805 family)
MEMMLLPLKRYFDFSGRSRRMEFWMFILFQFIVNMVFAVVVMAAGGAALMAAGNDVQSLAAAGGVVVVLYAINALFALALFIPNIAVSIRRLHDTNRTGWWILAPIGPYILSLVFIGMAFAVPDMAIVAGIVSAVGMLAFLGLGITLLVFYFLDGTPGPNRFGHDPKQRGYEHTFA